jgi:hypothetical protein
LSKTCSTFKKTQGQGGGRAQALPPIFLKQGTREQGAEEAIGRQLSIYRGN